MTVFGEWTLLVLITTHILLHFLSPVPLQSGVREQLWWVPGTWPGSALCTSISAPGTVAKFLKYLWTKKGQSTALGSRERGRPHPSDSLSHSSITIECKDQNIHPFCFYDSSIVHTGPPLFPFVLILSFLLSLSLIILRTYSCFLKKQNKSLKNKPTKILQYVYLKFIFMFDFYFIKKPHGFQTRKDYSRN